MASMISNTDCTTTLKPRIKFPDGEYIPYTTPRVKFPGMNEAFSRGPFLESTDDKLDCQSTHDYTFDIEQRDIKVAFPEDNGLRTLQVGQVWITYKKQDAEKILENSEAATTFVAPVTTTNGQDDEPEDLSDASSAPTTCSSYGQTSFTMALGALSFDFHPDQTYIRNQWDQDHEAYVQVAGASETGASSSIPALSSPDSRQESTETSDDSASAASSISRVSTLNPFATASVPPASISAPARALSPLAASFVPSSASIAPRSTLNPRAAPFEPSSTSFKVESTLHPLAEDFIPSAANNTVDTPTTIGSVSASNLPAHQEWIESTLNAEAADFIPESIFHATSNAVDEVSSTSSDSSLQPASDVADVLENEENDLFLASDEDDSLFGSSDDEDVFHHRNFFGDMVPCKSNTPPATSLAIIMSKPKLFLSTKAYEKNLHLYTLLQNACVWLDPVIYWGSLPILRHARGSTLQMSVTGVCAKLYSPAGSWQTDTFYEDEDKAYPDHGNHDEDNAVLNGWLENHGVPTVTKVLAVSNEVFDEAYPDFTTPFALVRRKAESKARGRSRLCEVTDIADSDDIAGESIDFFSPVSAPTSSTFAQQLEALAPLGTSSSWADDIDDEEVAITATEAHVSTFAQQLEALAPLGTIGDWADEFDDEEVAGEITKETVSTSTEEVNAPFEPCLDLVKWAPPISWAAPHVEANVHDYLPAIPTLASSGDHTAYLDPAPVSTYNTESLDIQAPEMATSESSRALVKWQLSQSLNLSDRSQWSNADWDLAMSRTFDRISHNISECFRRLDIIDRGHVEIRKEQRQMRAQIARLRRPRRVLRAPVRKTTQPLMIENGDLDTTTSIEVQPLMIEDGASDRTEGIEAQFPHLQQGTRTRREAHGPEEFRRVRGMVRSPGIHGHAYGGQGLRGFLLAQKAERAAQQVVPEVVSPFAPITDDLAPIEDEVVSEPETPEVDEDVDMAEPQAQRLPKVKKITFAPIDTEHRFFKQDTPSLAISKEHRTAFDHTNRHLDEPVIDSDGAERVHRSLRDRRLWGDVHPNRLMKYAALNTNIEKDTDHQDASDIESREPSPVSDAFPRPLTPNPYSTRQSSVLKSYGDLSETLNIAPEIRPELTRARKCTPESFMSEFDEAAEDIQNFWLGDLHGTNEESDSIGASTEHVDNLVGEEQSSQDIVGTVILGVIHPSYGTQLEAIEEEADTPELTHDENSQDSIEPFVEQVIGPIQGTEIEHIEEEAKTPELTSDEDSGSASPGRPNTPIFPSDPSEFESFPEFDTLRIKKRSFRRASWDKVTQLITQKRSPSASTNHVYAIVGPPHVCHPLPVEINKKSTTKKLVKGLAKGVKKLFGREVNVLR